MVNSRARRLLRRTLDRDSLDHCFYFEVIKDKQSIGKQPISKKGALVFGRSDQADVQVAHPSLSRQHAVVLHVMVGKEGEEKKVTPPCDEWPPSLGTPGRSTAKLLSKARSLSLSLLLSPRSEPRSLESR